MGVDPTRSTPIRPPTGAVRAWVMDRGAERQTLRLDFPLLANQFKGTDLFLADGELLDEVGADLVAAPGRVGNGNFAGRRNGDLGLDDVFTPVAPGCGDIAWQGEVFQRREGDVMGAADARLEHTAAPDWDAALLGRVVDGDGFGKSPHAAKLDVDDLAGLHLDGGQSVTAVVNGFVEADGGLQALLQQGVVEEVVVPEGLLDHEQVEGVELNEVVDVFQLVGRVGVAAEHDCGPAVAHFLEDFDGP